MDAVDFSDSNYDLLADQLLYACQQDGCFLAFGFDKVTDLMRKAQRPALEFFARDITEKRLWNRKGDIQGFAIREETGYGLGTHSKEEAKQVFDYSSVLGTSQNTLHAETGESIAPYFDPIIPRLFHDLAKIEKVILEQISIAFSRIANRPTAKEALRNLIGNHNGLLRLNYFPERKSVSSSDLREGSHTDWSTITIVWSQQPGLTVKIGQSWEKVKVPPDGFVVNVGELMEILTDGEFKACKHRVDAIDTGERISFVYFGAEVPDRTDDRLLTPMCRPERAKHVRNFNLKNEITTRIEKLQNKE